MISTLRFEFYRLFTVRITIGLLLLVIASLYFTYLGASEYKQFLQDKKSFAVSEKDKIKHYVNYEQYGAVGFRVLLEPSPLVVFFNRSDFVQHLEANVDTSEIVNVYNNRKGQKAFSIHARLGDLNQVITILGTFIMALLGFSTFPTRAAEDFFGKRYFIKTIAARLLLLNSFFILLIAAGWQSAKVWGVTFNAGESGVFLNYGIAALLLLNFSFLVGLVVKVLFKYRKQALSALLIAWFVLVFVFPELTKAHRDYEAGRLPSVEKVNLQQLHTLLAAEQEGRQIITSYLSEKHESQLPETEIGVRELKKLMKQLYDSYIADGYLENKAREEILLEEMKKKIDTFISLHSFSPIDLFNIAAADASGKGYRAYLGFLEYVLRQRDKFMKFYGRKRYNTDETGEKEIVESFIKGAENIYRYRARLNDRPDLLPGTGMPGKPAAIPAIYIAILVLVLYFLHGETLEKFRKFRERRWKNGKKNGKNDNKNDNKNDDRLNIELPTSVKPSSMLFVLAGKGFREAIYKTFKGRYYSCLDADSPTGLNREVKAGRFIDYACREKKIEKNAILKNLETFGIKEDRLKEKLADYTMEERKQVLCAIVFAEVKDLVFNDFIKGASRKFEEDFLSLVSRSAVGGRKIVYISSDMYGPVSSFAGREVTVNGYQTFQVTPLTISCR